MSEQISLSVAPQTNYDKIIYASPYYKMLQLNPKNNSQEVILSTSGGQRIEIDIPSTEIYNLSKSYLEFNLESKVVNNARYLYVFSDLIPMFREVFLQTNSGINLVSLYEAHRYSKSVRKAESSVNLINDNIFGGDNANGLGGENRSDLDFFSSISITSVSGRPVSNSSIINNEYGNPIFYKNHSSLKELCQTMPSLLHNTADTITFKVKVNLYSYVNTLLSLNKDLYFNQKLKLIFVLESFKKICFQSQSPNDPSGAYDQQPVEISQATIKNLTLKLAVQQNELIRSSIKEIFVKKGLKLLIPFVSHNNRTYNSGGSQQTSIILNKQHGQRLMKVFISPYLIETDPVLITPSEVWDNTNACLIRTANGGGGEINATSTINLLNFYTQLDNRRIQDLDITTSNFKDYEYIRQNFKGSIATASYGSYFSDWFYCDDFTGCGIDHPNKDNLILGLDLSKNIKWDFIGNFTKSTTHYVWAITQRELSIDPSGNIILM